MRYYVINSEGREVSFDISSIAPVEPSGIKAYTVSHDREVKKEYFVKNLAGKNYVSEDQKSWEKLPKIHSTQGLVNVSETLNIYTGFKPSGLSNAKAGDLITEMPGKIVKIMTTEGAVVSEGDTLVILEAMKMENEIKSGVSGIVKAVHIEEGQVLESGHLMVEIEE